MRGDNAGAITMLIKMRPSSPKIATVARELALRLVELSFPPDAVHTPGLAHVIADKLSRIYAPGGSGSPSADLHPALAHAELTPAPERNSKWYKAYKQEAA